MKQILQNIKTGRTELVDVPAPLCRPGHVLIGSMFSLISAGTERMLVDFGKAGWLQKARSQPDKVKQVMDKIRTDGLLPTMAAVFNKLDEPLPLGYCNAGVVLDVGSGVTDILIGDGVASNGPHAETVCIPRNLCAKIPESVSNEEAAFTVLGAIALQGVRLAAPTLGERFVVFGLGLVGLLTVQLLRANGCPVLAVDVSEGRLRLAEGFGAGAVNVKTGVEPVAAALAWSGGKGVDAVIIAASAKGDEIVHQAASACRKRGRIILVGVVDLNLRRSDLYEKEITFQVSCSYGPGRYDEKYEQGGQDYPFGFVRWTEQRNLEAVLKLMADGKLNVKPLISHRFPIDQAQKAYDLLLSKEPYLGILLEYKKGIDKEPERVLKFIEPIASGPRPRPSISSPFVSFIGAGNYAGRVLMPAFQKTGAVLKSIATNGGINGVHYGKKFGFQEASTDAERVFSDLETNAVVIATRHNSHARFVCEALKAGKHVFVEKPLCLTQHELDEIESVYSSLIPHPSSLVLMVGFNRRLAPQIVKIKELLQSAKSPKSFIMTVNAGQIPPDHWTQDPEVGGGRIIGEACHFIDLLLFLAGSQIVSSSIEKMRDRTGDTATIQLSFKDGSMGSIHYFSNGSRRFPKERLEIFCGGKILQLDNFRKMQGYGWPGFKSMNLWRQDKGQNAAVKAFVDAIRRGGPSPIPFEEIIEVAKVSIELAAG